MFYAILINDLSRTTFPERLVGRIDERSTAIWRSSSGDHSESCCIPLIIVIGEIISISYLCGAFMYNSGRRRNFDDDTLLVEKMKSLKAHRGRFPLVPAVEHVANCILGSDSLEGKSLLHSSRPLGISLSKGG